MPAAALLSSHALRLLTSCLLACSVLACMVLGAGVLPAAAQEPAAPQQPLPRGSRVAVLPLRGEGGSSAQRNTAEAAVVRAYGDIGYDVASPARVAQKLPGSHPARACLQPRSRCPYPALLDVLDVDAVVIGALWGREGDSFQAVVRVVRADGAEGSAQQAVKPSRLSRGMQAVAAAALAHTEQPAQVPVRIETHPQGAMVTIDRRYKAAAPAALQLSPGQHLVMVSHPGYLTRSDFVRVPETPEDEAFVHEVTLQRDDAQHEPESGTGVSAAPPASSSRPRLQTTRPSPWNYVAAGALAAVAAPLLFHGLYTAATVGDCVDHDALRNCREEVTFGPKAGLSLGVGAAAALGSAYFFVFTPITVTVGEGHATVQLRGQF